MSKTIACIIVRTVSTRLPLKALRHVCNGMCLLDFIIQRIKSVPNIDKVYICTSYEIVDDILEDIAADNGVEIYRGSPDAVIERMIDVGDKEKADNVIRITGDNIFTAYEFLQKQIDIHNKNNFDYTRIINLPVGVTAEVMRLDAVKKCYTLMDPAVSQYLLLYMFDPDNFKCGVLKIKQWPDYSNMSLTVDVNDDLVRTRKILEYFPGEKTKITLKEILGIIHDHDIPYCTLDGSAQIKMPYNKLITYDEFKKDIEHRISKSVYIEMDG